MGKFILMLLLLHGVAFASEPELRFIKDGQVTTLGLSQLKKALPVDDIAFLDPEYGKPKKYRGFALGKVLSLAFGNHWQGPEYTEMIFTALDGYASVSTLEKISESGGYIVFEDREFPGWEPVGRNQANPGPFYLVWTNPAQSTANEYPWPWQLAKIELVQFAARYPEVFPKGVKTDSPVYAGFLTFKGRCMRCHAMNQQGGKVGPDLNAPQSITEYRSPMMLKTFIRQPSQFRHTHMPDHTDLSDAQLDHLLDYLRYMASQRK